MSPGARKVLIVTGASRGIGAATARIAARNGYDVCINFLRSEDAALGLRDAIRRQGGRAIAVQADVAQEADILRLFDIAQSELGPVTALVNNAGISGGRVPAVDLTGQALKHVFAVNFFGAFYCTREAIRRMAKSSGGTGGAIVNVSSQAAQFGGIQLSHYAASKAALNTLTLALSREAARDGIRINAVSPGMIDTDLLESDRRSGQTDVIAAIPLGRLGRPEEVAETILWLLSDEASYITGAIVPLSGGR